MVQLPEWAEVPSAWLEEAVAVQSWRRQLNEESRFEVCL